MLVLGLSGWVKRIMALLPMPIVMGMVAGVFLRFGWIWCAPCTATSPLPRPWWWRLCCCRPCLYKRLPPLIGALLVGAVAVALGGQVNLDLLGSLTFAQPVVQAPVWSVAALVELVVPLAITVLVVQNGQGGTKAAGHEPPVNAIAVACGLGSFLSAAVGSVSTRLTGPSNADDLVGHPRAPVHRRADLWRTRPDLGLMAPTFTGLMLATPKEFIMVLGGLATLRVLQGAFVASFARGRFTLGALISLLVTVADLGVWNIGAAFWGWWRALPCRG